MTNVVVCLHVAAKTWQTGWLHAQFGVSSFACFCIFCLEVMNPNILVATWIGSQPRQAWHPLVCLIGHAEFVQSSMILRIQIITTPHADVLGRAVRTRHARKCCCGRMCMRSGHDVQHARMCMRSGNGHRVQGCRGMHASMSVDRVACPVAIMSRGSSRSRSPRGRTSPPPDPRARAIVNELSETVLQILRIRTVVV